jgi:hypothetical protein
MRSIEDLRLDNQVHMQLVALVEEVLPWFVREERDEEDGVWPDLSDVLEVKAMNIVNTVKGK